jgi:hypothetical protein
MPAKQEINGQTSTAPTFANTGPAEYTDTCRPMLTAGRQHKYNLCITDAFTKYALVTAVENKEAKIVAKAIFLNDFVNLASQHKFTLMGGRSLLTNFQMNCLPYLTFYTLKQLWPILYATHRLKFSTKLSINI